MKEAAIPRKRGRPSLPKITIALDKVLQDMLEAVSSKAGVSSSTYARNAILEKILKDIKGG